jgi:hypothetical protein
LLGQSPPPRVPNGRLSRDTPDTGMCVVNGNALKNVLLGVG